MTAVAPFTTCTSQSSQATQFCCNSTGASFQSPNKCLRTNVDSFSACVNKWNADQWTKFVNTSHANLGKGANLTGTGNHTKPRHLNATVKCWAPPPKNEAGRIQKSMTLGVIAFTVLSVASYTAL